MNTQHPCIVWILIPDSPLFVCSTLITLIYSGSQILSSTLFSLRWIISLMFLLIKIQVSIPPPLYFWCSISLKLRYIWIWILIMPFSFLILGSFTTFPSTWISNVSKRDIQPTGNFLCVQNRGVNSPYILASLKTLASSQFTSVILSCIYHVSGV